jgi:hypothetical protein
MITHSAICGPWTPEELVKGIFVSFQIGVSGSRSAPALKRWMSFTFLTRFTSVGRVINVTRIVASLNHSETVISGSNSRYITAEQYHQERCCGP